MASLVLNIWRKKSTFVEVWSLVNGLVSWWVEFYHHCGVHFWTSRIHCCCIYIVESRHSCWCILSVLSINLKHILMWWLLLITHMLLYWNILNVVVILLFAAKGQFCTFVELVSISLSRYVHHDEVFSCSIIFIRATIIIVICLVVAHVAAIACNGAVVETTDCQTHHLLLVFVCFSWLVQVHTWIGHVCWASVTA